MRLALLTVGGLSLGGVVMYILQRVKHRRPQAPMTSRWLSERLYEAGKVDQK